MLNAAPQVRRRRLREADIGLHDEGAVGKAARGGLGEALAQIRQRRIGRRKLVRRGDDVVGQG